MESGRLPALLISCVAAVSMRFAMHCVIMPASSIAYGAPNLLHAMGSPTPIVLADSDLMKELFWETFKHLGHVHPKFLGSGKYSKFPKKFSRMIYAIDSSTVELVLNCIDWAKHRRRKAASKLHLSLCLNNMLPKFAIIEECKRRSKTVTFFVAVKNRDTS